MQRRVKRSAQKMYVPPGLRPKNIHNNTSGFQVTINQNNDEPKPKTIVNQENSFTENEVSTMLSSFADLSIHDNTDKKTMEDSLIKLSKTLVQGINSQPKAIVEKLVKTLISQGKILQDDNPVELDSLINLIRDKILEKETQPSTKRYLFHVVEWKAREFRLL